MTQPGSTTTDQRLLAESLGVVAPVAEDMITDMYRNLFRAYPNIGKMFPTDPAAMAAQQGRLLQAVVLLAEHYDDPDRLTPTLTVLGESHTGRGVQMWHYVAVGTTLVAALAKYAGAAWTEEYEAAWVRAYTWAAGTMMAAGARAGAAVGGRVVVQTSG